MANIAKKVIVSGNVIEIYEYEKEVISSFKNEKDDYDPFDFDNINPKEVDRVEQRRQQTLRDSRNLARRLALMNFGSNDKFITLTFDPKKFTQKELVNLHFVDEEFKKFIKRFNYRFKTKLKYIAVREKHKNGRFHFHFLCDWDYHFKSEEEIREYERLLGEQVWKHGFVDIKQIDHVDNVGAYMVKYMMKNFAYELFKGKKCYLCSRGLERPLVYTDYNADLIIEQYGLSIKKEVFTNCYESEYLGKITYKEYNLMR